MRAGLSGKFKQYIVVAIHIVLSFLWEKAVFRNVGINPSGTIALSNAISDKAEQIITYSLTHLFAAVMIFYLWKLLFHLFSGFKKEYIIFLALFSAGALFIFICWPEVLTGSAGFDDNLVTYSCGVRLTPDYWHGVYSSIIYAAMLLVCPFNFFITLFQWGLFLFVLGYVFFRINGAKAPRGYLTFLVLLLPAALYLASNGHRMFQFTILVILYTAVIAMDIYEHRERSVAEIFKLALLGSFISVFRSEGVIIGALLFGIYLLFRTKTNLKSVIGWIAVFAVLFVIMSLPGKIGDKKYYGKDYSMINTFDVLKNILNDDSVNLSYDGAEDDLAAITRVAPLEIVRDGGTDGYRRYNYNIRGHKDINQSGEDAASGEAFMQAYRHIVSNNLNLYAHSQLNSVFVAIGVGRVFEVPEYDGETVSLDNWYYCGWDSGVEDFYASSFTKRWYENKDRKKIADYVLFFRDKVYDFLKNRKFYVTGAMLLVAFGLALFVRGAVAFFKKKDMVKTAVGCMFLTGVVSFFAVCAVMPTSATIYFIGSLYCLLTLVLIFVSMEWKGFFAKSKNKE